LEKRRVSVFVQRAEAAIQAARINRGEEGAGEPLVSEPKARKQARAKRERRRKRKEEDAAAAAAKAAALAAAPREAVAARPMELDDEEDVVVMMPPAGVHGPGEEPDQVARLAPETNSRGRAGSTLPPPLVSALWVPGHTPDSSSKTLLAPPKISGLLQPPATPTPSVLGDMGAPRDMAALTPVQMALLPAEPRPGPPIRRAGARSKPGVHVMDVDMDSAAAAAAGEFKAAANAGVAPANAGVAPAKPAAAGVAVSTPAEEAAKKAKKKAKKKKLKKKKARQKANAKEKLDLSNNPELRPNIMTLMRSYNFMNEARWRSQVAVFYANKFKAEEGQKRLIAYGNWSCGSHHISGSPPVPRGRMLRSCIQRDMRNMVYLMDEFRTSITCHMCGTKMKNEMTIDKQPVSSPRAFVCLFVCVWWRSLSALFHLDPPTT